MAKMRPVETLTILMLVACASCASDSPQVADQGDQEQDLEDDLRQYFEDVQNAYFASADSSEISQEDRIRIKLDEVLFNFATEHSVSTDRLQSMLGDLAINRPLWSKAGVGMVDHPLYVVVEGSNNAILLDKEREWTGKPSDEAEVVLVSSDREVVDESSFDYNDGAIIFFSPDEIRFIDLSTNSGGRYKRATQSEAGE